MTSGLTRREILLLAGGIASPLAVATEIATRPIPTSGERLPALGLGTWITFDVRRPEAIRQRTAVMRAFFAAGGRLIDSSPMYGHSPDVIGQGLRTLGAGGDVFSASKVWITGPDRGAYQIERSLGRWGVERFDLLQIHNMLDWQRHLPRLVERRAAGGIRYIGITTSHGRRHAALADALRKHPFDSVQLTYNLGERSAERELLPLAAERGCAVIVNRPFATGGLFARVHGLALPGWAADINCSTWAQVFLKFVISHPAVTVAIPATTRVDHVRENMAALTGPMPDSELRRRMARDFDRL